MAFSVSIGDAIMLSKIAMQLGQAFTSGRKSAQAEFLEVQNLLYTLSKGLEMLARQTPDGSEMESKGPPNQASDKEDKEMTELNHIIANCRETLYHLESVVIKYSVLDAQIVETRKNRMRRWNDELFKNWKKVIWTTKGGDIGILKVTLTAHINGLNLAVSILNRKQGKAVHEQVDMIHTKLEEIYSWFTDNLREKNTMVPQRQAYTPPDATNNACVQGMSFAVYCERNARRLLICPHASFQDDWVSAKVSTGPRGIFKCCCEAVSVSNSRPILPNSGPHSQDLNFSLLPVSLLIRDAGPGYPRKWRLFAASLFSNAPEELELTGINPSNIAEFERHVDRLAVAQAVHESRLGRNDMLIHCLPDDMLGGIFSILDTKTTQEPSSHIIGVHFTANGRRFTQLTRSVQLLHYRYLAAVTIPSSASDVVGDLAHQAHAELIFHCKAGTSRYDDGQSELRYVVHIIHSTTVKRTANQRVISIVDVFCMSESENAKVDEKPRIKCSVVEVEFDTRSSAERFFINLEAMKEELFILYLQCPLSGEQLVFQWAAGNLMVRDFIFRDAQLSMIMNSLTGKYRLILVSACHSVSVCVELPQDFFQKTDSEFNPVRISQNYLAWFVEVGTEGTTVIKQSMGFSFLPIDRGPNQSLPIIKRREPREYLPLLEND